MLRGKEKQGGVDHHDLDVFSADAAALELVYHTALRGGGKKGKRGERPISKRMVSLLGLSVGLGEKGRRGGDRMRERGMRALARASLFQDF